MDVLLGLLGLVLFTLVVGAVVVGWRIGSWWAVPAATAGGFVGPALLVGVAEMDHARTSPVSSVDLARLIYPMGYAACIGLGLVAGVVSALAVASQRDDGTPPVNEAARFWLVGGAVAGLLLIGWWVVLVEWAADELLNGQSASAPVPTARFLAVLLAGGLGAVGGGSGGLVLRWAGAARGRAHGVVDGGIYLGALAGLLLLAVVGLPAAPGPERSALGRGEDDSTRYSSAMASLTITQSE